MTLKSISFENVHRCTTYELRQALKKRGEFLDDYSGTINYEILLQRMVQVLQDEQRRRDEHRVQLLSEDTEGLSLAERLTKSKEERKAAAVERSRQRQKDPTYFAKKKQLDTAHRLDSSKENMQEDSRFPENDQTNDLTNNIRNDSEVPNEVRDPFAPSFRSKFGGKHF